MTLAAISNAIRAKCWVGSNSWVKQGLSTSQVGNNTKQMEADRSPVGRPVYKTG